MQSSSKADKLERELQQARELGRWLSDDERSAIENHEQQKLELIEQQRHNRSRLIVFTVVCLLVPPLWGLAIGISAYLLFPKTFNRVLLIAGGGLILAAAILLILTAGILFVLVNLLF